MRPGLWRFLKPTVTGDRVPLSTFEHCLSQWSCYPKGHWPRGTQEETSETGRKKKRNRGRGNVLFGIVQFFWYTGWHTDSMSQQLCKSEAPPCPIAPVVGPGGGPMVEARMEHVYTICVGEMVHRMFSPLSSNHHRKRPAVAGRLRAEDAEHSARDRTAPCRGSPDRQGADVTGGGAICSHASRLLCLGRFFSSWTTPAI
ncbi:hypothetical protein B0T21DRAFT_62758 [Apiosordaria backusii]|uniref:Uncharacterized protein n=1 Tax=Apiosordaria backusii TaxID=314023 RepID=A0AA40AIL5_9PEZI|nr:hypothetical protein B0T21DRAFT_62758 [Apiosordaria backusii]